MAKKKPTSERRKYNRIKDVLEEKELTQTWLSEQIDLHFVTITRYVNNHRHPSIATLIEIAMVLKVNPKDLLNS
jgi:putative transcriptional regulator